MPRVRVPWTNWSHGEVTPLLAGRLELDQLQSSAELIENYLVLETGAVTRRPGMRYVARGRRPNAASHLLPFVFSSGDAYMLEFTEGAIRFFRSDGSAVEVGGLPVEVATPYLQDEIPSIQWAPSNDVIFLAHPNHHPRKLERYADTVWKLRLVSVGNRPKPSLEFGTRPPTGCTLTPAGLSGSGIICNTSSAIFLASDVAQPDKGPPPREIVVTGGVNTGARATITKVNSPTQVEVEITEAFAQLVGIPFDAWHISGSPLTTCEPSNCGPVGAAITLTLGHDGWRAPSAGQFVRINGGIVELFTGSPFSATVVPGIVRALLTGTQDATQTPAEPGAWSLEEAAWSTLNGFPSAVTFLDGRLYFAGSPVQPNTLWGSVVSDFENFSAGHLDDDAVQRTLDSDQANRILWLTGGRVLVAGTQGDGFVITGGGVNDVITPANFQARPGSSSGSAPIRPLRVGNVLLFVTRSGRRLRELVYDYASDAYVEPDILLLASHLPRPVRYDLAAIARDLTRLAYQQEPLSLVWATRADGVLLACTYLRDQNVVAWSRQPTDGQVESVAVIPKPDGKSDRVWVSVARTINGLPARTIEYLDDDGLVYDRLHVDSAKTYDFRQAAGLHLSAVTGDGIALTSPASLFAPADVGREVWVLPDDVQLVSLLAGELRPEGVTFTTPTNIWSPGDVGRTIRRLDGPGVARITEVIDATHALAAPADVLAPWGDMTTVAAGRWTKERRGRALIRTYVSATQVLADVTQDFDAADLGANLWGIARTDLASLSHLEGREVDVVGDGAPQTRKTVTGNTLTADTPALRFEVGLPYVSLLKTHRPNVALAGPTQGTAKHGLEVLVRVEGSLNLLIRRDDGRRVRVLGRRASDAMDRPPTLYTGDEQLKGLLGVDYTGQLAFVQDQPLPSTLVYVQGLSQVAA